MINDLNSIGEKVGRIINSIDRIWENMNISEFKKGNEELINLISDIESIIGIFQENTDVFHSIISSLNNIMKAMENKDYILETDILKYELKNIFIEYKNVVIN